MDFAKATNKIKKNMNMKNNNKNFNNFILPNKNWIEWFIGFLDGDGNFQIFPKLRNYFKKSGELSNYFNVGYGIHISLSLKDYDLLLDIQAILQGMGNLYKYEDKDEARLAITKLSELEILVTSILNQAPFIILMQRERYNRLSYGILNKINRFETHSDYINFINTNFSKPISEELNNEYFNSKSFDNWIQGFINGEGSFHIHKKGHLTFYIEHTDKNALINIKNRFNFGPNVIEREARPSLTYRNSKLDFRLPTYALHISSQKDINTLKDFCSNKDLAPLAGAKLIQFNNWISHSSI